MIRISPSVLVLAFVLGSSPLLAAPVAEKPDPAGVEYFERHIRPILDQYCYSCHSRSAEKLKGGLYLDSRAGMLTGGDSGPSIVPGDPDKSLFIKAVRYLDEDMQMPPKSKLPEEKIQLLVKWIEMGAPDPRIDDGPVKTAKPIDIEAGRQHWAYQPVRRSAAPPVKDAAWPRGDIDRYILAGLENAGLSPAADADRRTLIRRLSYDLVGLPPTPEEIDAFLADRSSQAVERVVDRLLNSPGFGERWGRHWLDVVRFGESLTLRGFIIKDSWRYRDYVIEAFNTDRPFDVFIAEQIAGDLLPADSMIERQRRLVATMFLTIGNHNLEEQDKKLLVMDAVDEQMDVIGKGILAQTITCARCHDHKFDPIAASDYYAIAGILKNTRLMEHANISKPIEVKLPIEPEKEAIYKEHEAEIAAVQEQIKKLKSALAKVNRVPADTIVEPSTFAGVVVDDAQAKQVGEWRSSTNYKRYIGVGYAIDQNTGKGEKTITFAPDELPRDGKYEVRLAYVTGAGRASRVPVTVFSADGEVEILVDQTQTPPIDGRWISLGTYRFEKNGQSFVIVSNANTTGHVTADAVQFLPSVTLAATSDSGATADAGSADSMNRQMTRLESQLKKLQKSGPRRPSILGVAEEEVISDLAIHVRGNPNNLGEVVPRGVMRVATYGEPPVMPKDQSGRVQLAQWLASPQNPLTARVFVNRAWHWLFGVGLVRSTDNFGTTGDVPSHPELLDHLAAAFVDEGWSVKQLVRRIVLSRTYQLASTAPDRVMEIDPENRLLSHAHRRRLDAESIRDTLLAVAGTLKPDRGGITYDPTLASDLNYPHHEPLRSVYVPAFRNALPEIFEVFDFADPSSVTGVRNVSTVAPQALFMMNHPFVMEQATAAAEKLLRDAGSDEQLIDMAYQRAIGRSPTAREMALARRFLSAEAPSSDPAVRTRAAAKLMQAIFASIDFRYLQ